MKGQHNKQKIDKKESCGNVGSVESEESQKQASHSFHEPLGNLANSSEIPTFPPLRRRILSFFETNKRARRRGFAPRLRATE
jgi:hypothetical protein